MRKKLAVISLVGALLRIVAIAKDRLWYDEVYTAVLSQKGWLEIATGTAADVHPPLWYWVTKAFTLLLGQSEAVLRLPALICGLAVIPLTYRLARAVGFSERAGLLAAGLLAVSPFAVYYSNEARMYSGLMLAVLLALIGALEGRGWLVALASGVIMLLHNMGAIYMPVIGLLAWRKFGFRRAAFWCSLGLLPWMAWLPSLVSQVTTLSGGYWTALFFSNLASSTIFALGKLLFQRFAGENLITAFSILAVALAVFPAVEVVRRRPAGWLALLGAVFGPLAVLVLISIVWQPVMLFRVLAGLLPPWLVLIAWWLADVERTWDIPRLALGAYAVGMLVFCLGSYYAIGRYPMQYVDWIQDNLEESDTLCHIDAVVAYYTHRPGIKDLDACNVLMVLDFPTLQGPFLEEQKALARGGQHIYSEHRGVLLIDIYRLSNERRTSNNKSSAGNGSPVTKR